VDEHTTSETPAAPASFFLPQLIVALGLVIWTGFQTTMLVGERSTLNTARAEQEATIQQAVKLRAQLDSIAAKTQMLADRGNTGAKTIVEELKKRGVTIDPNATTTQAQR
jgi:hypothetical protein